MPKRKTPQQANLATETSAIRTQLNILRSDLLASVQELHIDSRMQLPLDATCNRVILCKELVSSKRITQKLVLGVVENAIDENQNARVPDAIMLFITLKTQLLNIVDKKSHSCDVVDAHSHEAQRQPRDGSKSVMGYPSMLTDEMIANANEIWELKTQSSHIAQKRKVSKKQPIAQVECDATPMSPSSGELFTVSNQEPSPQKSSASSVGADEPPAVVDEVEFPCADVEVDATASPPIAKPSKPLLVVSG